MIQKPTRLKCVLLGSSGVGKSSLATRWIQGWFDETPEPTIGAAYLTKQMTVDDTRVKVELWDTAGQERYRSLTPLYYRGAAITIIVYDCTRETNDVAEWRTRVHDESPHAVVVVAATKSDVCDPKTPLPDDVIAYRTSAKTNDNVDALFNAAIRQAMQTTGTERPSTTVEFGEESTTKRRKCCR